MSYQGPGLYQHYKGGRYDVLGLGVHEHAKEHQPNFDPDDSAQQYVVYRPLTDGSLLHDTSADFWIRRLDNFNETRSVGITPVTVSRTDRSHPRYRSSCSCARPRDAATTTPVTASSLATPASQRHNNTARRGSTQTFILVSNVRRVASEASRSTACRSWLPPCCRLTSPCPSTVRRIPRKRNPSDARQDHTDAHRAHS
jgi:hypothetical protein